MCTLSSFVCRSVNRGIFSQLTPLSTAPADAAQQAHSLLTLPSKLMPDRSSTSSQPGPDGGLGGAFPIRSRRSMIMSKSSSLMSLLCGIPSGQESTRNPNVRGKHTSQRQNGVKQGGSIVPLFLFPLFESRTHQLLTSLLKKREKKGKIPPSPPVHSSTSRL